MGLERFVETWTSSHYPPERVHLADMQTLERTMGVHLPPDYRESVLQTGLPRPTIALLNSIVDQDLPLRDVGDFYSPAEMLEQTSGWREAGMPSHLIAFATDSAGNMFCFDAERLRAGSADRDSVWFFDHDIRTVDHVAPSFDNWIMQFCDVRPSPGDGTGSVR
ncbi:SMI1/KNR4 family protein [Sphingomonas faeni]|uniref:SMI1/KNR4 family protein n=1 Tax=Sphingomonas faeni TaxID=185950 RepID=UPI003345E9CD